MFVKLCICKWVWMGLTDYRLMVLFSVTTDCWLKILVTTDFCNVEFNICVEVLRPSQPNRIMSSAVSLPNHTFTGQA